MRRLSGLVPPCTSTKGRLTDLERIARQLGPFGIKTLADDLDVLLGWGRVTLYMTNGGLDRIEATRSTKNGAQPRLNE